MPFIFRNIYCWLIASDPCMLRSINGDKRWVWDRDSSGKVSPGSRNLRLSFPEDLFLSQYGIFRPTKAKKYKNITK